MIISIVGARPNIIKLAAISNEMAKYTDHRILHTGQHYDYTMDKIFFDAFKLRAPEWNLGVGSGPHGKQTGMMLMGAEEILKNFAPDAVIVYGDTNSTLAGALAAVKMHIPTVHIEAGVRSHDMNMPEEVNRILVDHCANLLCCPTDIAYQNLILEGISAPKSVNTGDVTADIIKSILPSVEKIDVGMEKKSYIVATFHRAENTDVVQYRTTIVNALSEIAKECPVVFPMHPRTRGMLTPGEHATLTGSGVRILEPVDYATMIALTRAARCIVTDSGGLQKEAYLLGVPCVTTRSTTEWIETTRNGWNTLMPPQTSTPHEISVAALSATPARHRGKHFGDGHAARHIVDAIKEMKVRS